jgi:outer membrane protein W
MKKVIFMTAILSGSCFILKGQTLTVGPKAGINISSLSNINDIKSRVSFTAGGFLVYSFIENFGVGVDALYSKEGGKFESKFGTGEDMITIMNKLSLNYLRFNVPLIYFFRDKEDSFRPKIFAGPSLAFLMSAKEKKEIISAPDNSTIEVDPSSIVTDNYKGTDFGALVGAGFNYKLAEATWLNFDAAYHIGATDIPKDADQSEDAIKNHGFAITAGVGFGF